MEPVVVCGGMDKVARCWSLNLNYSFELGLSGIQQKMGDSYF